MSGLKGRRGTLNKGKGKLIYGFKLKYKEEKERVMQEVGVILRRAQDCRETCT